MEEILYNGRTSEEILRDMTYSYSSVSAFGTCPLMFKLQYLDKVKRADNIFAEIGSVSHEVMELLFSKEIEIFETDKVFLELYDNKVKCSPPPALGQKFEDGFKEKMVKFFINTDLDVDDYEVIAMEGKYEYQIDDVKLVIKPDLIAKRKSDGKIVLWDYKTSGYDKKKHAGYAKQCSLYKKVFELVTGMTIDEMTILYFKETTSKKKVLTYGRFIDLEYDENVLDAFVEEVRKIRQEKSWSANLDQFFCVGICSARNFCEEKEQVFGF